jgi:GNAT superfamily N-acetyltransferase
VTVRYRRGAAADDRAVHRVYVEAINEIDRRLGSALADEPGDEVAIDADWAKRRALFAHLAATADQFWVAEDGGRVLGYARSILRDGLRELTEFFVLPGHQGGGLGGELLARAFPAAGARQRAIIATLEPAALSRYLRSGVGARCLIAYIGRSLDPGRPSAAVASTTSTALADLAVAEVTADAAGLESLAAIDLAVLGHRRDLDHAWLLGDRQGLLYRRDDRVVGYGYVGADSGPFAVLEPADLPAVLLDAEARAAAAGLADFSIWLPLAEAGPAGELLARGYRIDPFLAVLLSDEPLHGLDRYVITSPPFFL